MNIEISPKEYERILTWHDANMYCSLLIIDDKNDWRLPTIEELDEIYDSENDFNDSYYWSSTEHDAIFALAQVMSGREHTHSHKDYGGYVRAVRTI